MEKQKERDSFKHQLWDLDEECHIEGETEFEATMACCDARNRSCNRSGFSAHQRVFGSSLRLLFFFFFLARLCKERRSHENVPLPPVTKETTHQTRTSREPVIPQNLVH